MTFVEHYVEEVSGESVDVVQALDLVQIDHQDFAKAVHDFLPYLFKHMISMWMKNIRRHLKRHMPSKSSLLPLKIYM